MTDAVRAYRKSGSWEAQRVDQTTAGPTIFTVLAVEKSVADAAIAALEAELERVKTGVVQTHMYRLPVLAIEVETGEQGVHWIDGLSAAEVFAVLRDDVPAPVYESIPKAVSEAWEQAEAEVQRLRVAEAEAMNILEGTELKLEQAEAEVALRDRMLVAEYDSPTPKTAGYMRWFADLRARAEKEAGDA